MIKNDREKHHEKRHFEENMGGGSARLIGTALLFTTIASAMPIKARADGGTYSINNGNITIIVENSGQRISVGNGNYTLDANPIISGNSSSHNIVINVPAGKTANVTLSDLTINESTSSQSAIYVIGGGNANIELEGNNTLQGGSGNAGLEVYQSHLKITDTDNDGSLTANGGANGAGIGGGNTRSGSNITIEGGTITANGGANAAGIGGGDSGDASYITIRGGNVTATGGQNAAGIGGGRYGAGSNITISGGTVFASGGDSGAGIGGGLNGAGSNITIEGGSATATGTFGGAGIGGGANGDGSNITIEGGTVTAVATDQAAGIGVGFAGAQSSVTINGGTVTASGGTYGAGIGGGVADITIHDGTVTATGGVPGGAGIGGRTGSQITITGGTVAATGGTRGAGIGGQYYENAGVISISGGTVFASGGDSGAGIGGGVRGTLSQITICDDARVYASGGVVDDSNRGAGAAIGNGGDLINDQTVDGRSAEDTGALDATGLSGGIIRYFAPGTSVREMMRITGFLQDPDSGNHGSGGSSHSETHIHSYSWVVTEKPTAYENGKMVYQCSCGHVLDRADIEASAELITDGITAFSTAAQGATVRMDFGYYFSINKAFATAHDARPDLTTIITYYYKGKHYEMTIPAGVTLLQTIDEKGWAGFKFIETFPGMLSREIP